MKTRLHKYITTTNQLAREVSELRKGAKHPHVIPVEWTKLEEDLILSSVSLTREIERGIGNGKIKKPKTYIDGVGNKIQIC